MSGLIISIIALNISVLALGCVIYFATKTRERFAQEAEIRDRIQSATVIFGSQLAKAFTLIEKLALGTGEIMPEVERKILEAFREKMN